MSPARIIKFAEITSYTCPSASTVLHSEWPQTLQQGLCPTSPPIQSSSRRLLIQMRLDSKGSFLNSAREISSFSKITSIPIGVSDCLRAETAFSTSFSVDPHRGHVSPENINRSHLILRTFAGSFSTDPAGEHPQPSCLFRFILLSPNYVRLLKKPTQINFI